MNPLYPLSSPGAPSLPPVAPTRNATTTGSGSPPFTLDGTSSLRLGCTTTQAVLTSDSTVSDIDAQIGTRLDPPLASISSVLITGGAGFIASFLVRKLVLLYPEWHIVVVDKLDYCSSRQSLADLHARPNFVFVQADITDAPAMDALVTTHCISTIIHLAAQTHVDNSFGNSLAFTQSNVLGTHILLESARKSRLARSAPGPNAYPGVTRFIHVSTDEVYGDISHHLPNADEESLLAPNNPYSATKAAAECLVRAYHRTYGLPVIITRSNNIYGPGQYPEKIIPKFICLLLEHRKCTVHGTGLNARRYLYVADVADALDVVLQRGQVGEIYNIGTDFELSNRDLARVLVRQFFPQCKDPLQDHCEWVADRALNDKRYAIDSAKVRRLGWEPRVAFEDGVRRTIDWYRKHRYAWWDNDIGIALQAHPDLEAVAVGSPPRNARQDSGRSAAGSPTAPIAAQRP